jgi:hypothetical protein
VASTTTVELSYLLKSAKTGQLLWKNHQHFEYTPDNRNGGLIGMLISAAIQKSSPNYIPLAQQANGTAIYPEGQKTPVGYGLPAGPYDSLYNKDTEQYH